MAVTAFKAVVVGTPKGQFLQSKICKPKIIISGRCIASFIFLSEIRDVSALYVGARRL